MKRVLLSIVASIFFCSTGFSQLSIQDTSGNSMTNGDTVVVSGVAGSQLSDRFFIFNNAPSCSVQVFCTATAIRAGGCTYSICVGTLCYSAYGDSVNFLCGKFTTPAGKNTNALYTDYNPYKAGVTIMRYDIRNTTAASDSTWFYVKFIASPVGVATITDAAIKVGALYPNPANNQVGFSYNSDSPAQLSIYNSLGQLVKLLPLPANKEHMDINTTDMASGIYICKVQITGGESTFRRLVVSH
ncbi:MAG TPA: T9SS type A sorting domain-containing protein [Bacteroidia bacterium]|nr:T9SS type A sorting domain-containing protein [Bacteroidia bacterium]